MNNLKQNGFLNVSTVKLHHKNGVRGGGIKNFKITRHFGMKMVSFQQFWTRGLEDNKKEGEVS